MRSARLPIFLALCISLAWTVGFAAQVAELEKALGVDQSSESTIQLAGQVLEYRSSENGFNNSLILVDRGQYAAFMLVRSSTLINKAVQDFLRQRPEITTYRILGVRRYVERDKFGNPLAEREDQEYVLGFRRQTYLKINFEYFNKLAGTAIEYSGQVGVSPLFASIMDELLDEKWFNGKYIKGGSSQKRK